jgi:hypothetical protein
VKLGLLDDFPQALKNLDNISKSFIFTGRDADCQMGHVLKSTVIACQFDPFLDFYQEGGPSNFPRSVLNRVVHGSHFRLIFVYLAEEQTKWD